LTVKVRPLSEHGLDVDDAADLIDVAAHHVHPDAASGNARHLRGGGEPRREDELVDLRLGHLVDFDLRGQALRHRLRLDPLSVESASVVGNLDDDVPALMISGEANRALFGLASGAPFGRRFQTMVGRVANHMGERILDQIEDLSIEFGIGSVHFELDLLAQFGREVAHDPRQLLPRIPDRLHSGLHHPFLELGGDVGEPL
jgi:hypothetical protein